LCFSKLRRGAVDSAIIALVPAVTPTLRITTCDNEVFKATDDASSWLRTTIVSSFWILRFFIPMFIYLLPIEERRRKWRKWFIDFYCQWKQDHLKEMAKWSIK
jgi:hypothetical protein